MADEITGGNTERIRVEVAGDEARESFNSIGNAAARASAQINQLGTTINQTQGGLGAMARAAGLAQQGLNQAGQAGQNAAGGINNAGNAAQNATNHFNAFQQSMFGHRGIGTFLWDLAIDGFKTAIGFAESFIERTSAVQRTLSLLATVDKGQGSESQFSYLTGVANNYGLSLRAIQDDYAKLNLAASTTAMTSDQVRRVFEQVSMATRTLHLNQQQTQLTFLAVEQMLSKGKISMEELRKQLAERLPGAMQALSRELGVSFQALDKFITKVGASSEKIVPELGNALQRLYQDAIPNAAKALDAEKNRLETSVAVFFKNVVAAGGTEGMSTLLRSINQLLQVDTISQTFADAMNRITMRIAEFLMTLKPEDIERFADQALKFLEAFAGLAMAAAKALVFLSQNLTMATGLFGALVGATAGAPFGPWGVAIGALVGGTGGAAFGAYAQSKGGGSTDLQDQVEKLNALDKKIQERQTLISNYDQPMGRASSLGEFAGNLFSRANRAPKSTLEMMQANDIRQRDALWAKIEPIATKMAQAQLPTDTSLPGLPGVRDMQTGSTDSMVKWLTKNFGLGGEHKKTAEERAAESLARRQQNFIEDLRARVASVERPETEKFEGIRTNMGQLGIKPGMALWDEGSRLINALQADYVKKLQEKSDKERERIETEFEGMKESAITDIGKFGEQYSTENLKQIDDQDWAAKARRMGNQLDAQLLQQQKRWDEMARKNPLFKFDFDREERLAEMRSMGEAYIQEFRRIEAERRTILGGAKSFLAEWNDNAMNLGQQSKEFFKGTTDGVVDMLTTALKTGQLSFAKLGEFMIDYILKMMVVRSITPFVNQSVDWLSGVMNAGAGAIGLISGSAPASSGLGLKLPGMAQGGQVRASQSYIVGERGFEVFRPSVPGHIIPNHRLRADGGMVQPGVDYGTGENGWEKFRPAMKYVEPVESIRPRGGDVNQVNVNVNIDQNGNAKVDAGNAPDLGRRLAAAVKAVLIDERRPGGMLS